MKTLIHCLVAVTTGCIYLLYLLQDSVGTLVFFLITFVLWGVIALLRLADGSRIGILVSLLTLSVPVSFRSITGGSYGDLPISYFNLFLLLLTLCTTASLFTKSFFRLRPIIFIATSSLLIFMTFVTISLLNSSDFVSALKQYINLVAVCCGVISALILAQQRQAFSFEKLMDDYSLATLLTGVILAIQIVAANAGVEIGQIDQYGSGRTAYGAFFTDYSFLALYLATGATIQLVKLSSIRISKMSLLYLPFLLGMSAYTSARTGLVACVASTALILGRHILIKRTIYRPYVYATFVIFAVMIAAVVLGRIRPDSFTSTSGRLDNYRLAVENFIENPLVGTGLGVSWYAEVFKTEIPHNLFLQYLVQIGAFGLIGLFIFILAIFVTALMTNRLIFEPFITMLVGSMFIPDTLNSRFFIIFIIAIITFRHAPSFKLKRLSSTL
jgi:O-antigen ligase